MTVSRPFWDDHAKYNNLMWYLKVVQNLHFEMVDLLQIEPGMKVLDFGGGTGLFVRACEEKGIKCDEIVVLDYSAPMLEIAKLEPFSGGRVSCLLGDLNQPHTAWGLGNRTFDRFVGNNSLYALGDPGQTLQEFHSVANTGARLVFSTPRAGIVLDQKAQAAFLAPNLEGLTGDALKQARDELIAKVGPLIPRNQSLAQQGIGLTEDQLRDWLAGSGWKVGRITVTYANDANWLVDATKR